MRRNAMSPILAIALLVSGLAANASAAGHFEMLWFRMWDKSENGGNHHVHIWVYKLDGTLRGNTHIMTCDGMHVGYTPPDNFNKFEWPLNPGVDYSFKCTDDAGSTSDCTPVFRTDIPGASYGHVSYEAGFIYKPDSNIPGDADHTLCGKMWEPGDITVNTPRTASCVYYCTYCPDYYSWNNTWSLCCPATVHSQSFP